MKVFFIGSASLDGMKGDTMEAHVIDAFHTMGFETDYFPFLSGGLGYRLNRLFERAMTDLHWIRQTPAEYQLLGKIRTFRPDLVLVLLGNYTSPSTIRKVRSITSAPVICWCQDHMGTMGRQYIIGSRFDYVFAKDQSMVDRLKQFTNLPEVHYLPEACNPKVHRSVTLSESDRQRFGCEITTAASLYYYRSEILSSLNDYDLKIWGPVPKYYDGPLLGRATGKSVHMRDKSACFNSARIVINTLFPMEIGGLNARAFEVAGCGGFQLITHTDAVARHFVPGKEIETFRDLKELRDKVNYYLEHEDERRQIAVGGQTRAHTEHTYELRLKQMLAVVGLL